jgi:hypothetical protein
MTNGKTRANEDWVIVFPLGKTIKPKAKSSEGLARGVEQ